MIPAEFHFLRPLWLLALLPLTAVVVWLLRRTPGLRRWANIVDPRLAPYVLIGGATLSRRLPAFVVGITGTLAVAALAGPVWQKLPQPVFSSQDALIILLDLSQSMNAEDIKPSRLERARFKVADILERRKEGQTALLVYAAESFAVSPLTDDTETIAAQLSALTPEIMPSQGSRADRAMTRALELLQQAGLSRGEVLLVTDGVNAQRDGSVAASLAADGLRVSVLGVGTEAGGPIPGPDGFIKRNDGSIVIAKLDSAALRAVASDGDGIYQDLTADNRDIERLGYIFGTGQPLDVSEGELAADIWREEGPWLLLPLLPLVALVFRRGILVVIAMLMVMPPVPAQAAETGSLWARPDQLAERALQAGDAETAAQLFQNPAWRAAAEYRAGQYEQALGSLGEVEGITASYNRGNALARLGRYEEAIAAYEDVLKQDPDNADAQYNRDLVQEQLQQQQQSGDSSEQSDNGEQQQSADSSEQSDNGEQQESEQQDSQAGESGDQSDNEQQSADASQGETDQSQEDESQQGLSDEEQQKADELEQSIAEAQKNEAEQGEQEQQALAVSDEPLDESEQAVEQWLRRIPDDPAGLLRRKFYYQYQRQQQPQAEPEQW